MVNVYINFAKINKKTIQVITPFEKRKITHVIHDIDGTHSLIRNWQPVMSICMDYAIKSGLPSNFDSLKNERTLIENTGKQPLPETDRYCIECAGFSAITQMEYAIRRAIENDTLSLEYKLSLSKIALKTNSEIIKRIWNGEESFDDVSEPQELKTLLKVLTPRLFKLYERVLNGASRDKNLADAKKHPEKWRVPGSLEFIQYLYSLGLINYFVTGAVVYKSGGMFEEVKALGYEIGKNKMIESLRGSSWDKKMPKDEVMKELFINEKINPANTLIIGDGRTEIKAGVEMGAITISRLAKDDVRQREIHRNLKTNILIEDYTSPELIKLFSKK